MQWNVFFEINGADNGSSETLNSNRRSISQALTYLKSDKYKNFKSYNIKLDHCLKSSFFALL